MTEKEMEALRELVPYDVAERLRTEGYSVRVIRAGDMDPDTEVVLVEPVSATLQAQEKGRVLEFPAERRAANE